MTDVELAKGEIPTQNWLPDDDRGFLEAFNEMVPADDGEARRRPSVPDEELIEKPESKPAEKPAKKAPEKAVEKPKEAPADEEPDEFFKEEEKPVEKGAPPPADGFDVEAFDAETERLSADMNKKQGDRFKELRAELKESKVEMAKMRSSEKLSEATKQKLAELEIKAQKADDLESEISELRNMSARIRLETGERYKTQVLKPTAGVLAKCEEIAARYEGLDPGVVKAVVRESDPRKQAAMMDEHLSELTERDRASIYLQSEKLSDILTLRDQLYAEAESEVATIEAERIEHGKRESEQRMGVLRTLQGDLWEKHEEKIPGLLDEDGVPTPEYEAMRKRGMGIDFAKAKETDLAYAAFAGVVLPHLIRQLAEVRKELRMYTGKSKRAQETEPRMKDGQPDESKPAGDDEDQGFMDRMKRTRF